MIPVFGYGLLPRCESERIGAFDSRIFVKDELLFRENLIAPASRLVPALAGGHQKALGIHCRANLRVPTDLARLSAA
jgi:hypothetical protein